MQESMPVFGMTISIRSRRDVVVVDPAKLLAAARQALRDVRPELTDAEAAAEIADVYDAVHALLDRDGQFAAEHIGEVIEVGHGAALPGVRIHDQPNGVSHDGISVGFVTGDECYGRDPRLRTVLQERGIGYVLAVARNQYTQITTATRERVDITEAWLSAQAWQRRSAGPGSKGERFYDWAWSLWRRRHQAHAKASHYRRRAAIEEEQLRP